MAKAQRKKEFYVHICTFKKNFKKPHVGSFVVSSANVVEQNNEKRPTECGLFCLWV